MQLGGNEQSNGAAQAELELLALHHYPTCVGRAKIDYTITQRAHPKLLPREGISNLGQNAFELQRHPELKPPGYGRLCSSRTTPRERGYTRVQPD